jgi:hypothetical protein
MIRYFVHIIYFWPWFAEFGPPWMVLDAQALACCAGSCILKNLMSDAHA